MSLAKALAGGIDLKNNITETKNLINYVNEDDADVTMGRDGNITNRGSVNEDQPNEQPTTQDCSTTFIKNFKYQRTTISKK